MINWISTKEVAKLPDTDRKVMVLSAGSDTIHTAIFRPELGWHFITSDYSHIHSSSIQSVAYWSDFNLPK